MPEVSGTARADVSQVVSPLLGTIVPDICIYTLVTFVVIQGLMMNAIFHTHIKIS